MATGPARQIEDFPGAYGAQHVNDGKVGTRFIATSNQLTIELPEPTPVNRIFFSSARGEQAPELFKFVFVADYRIETSLDGHNWQVVAHGRDRRPVAKKEGNPANPAPPRSRFPPSGVSKERALGYANKDQPIDAHNHACRSRKTPP